jgi:2,3-bisphosphoglycerate-independent phosphoglycerate mutase
LKKESLTLLIKASGKEVGLMSDKDAGNSEVGHNAIGSGQTISQGLSLIEAQIEDDKTFTENIAFMQMVKNSVAAKTAKKIHLVILLSNGRVHSDINHLFLTLKQLKKLKAKNIFIHALFDGRDVAPQSAKVFLKQLDDEIKALKVDAKLATVGGRNKIVMDRYETNTKQIVDAYNLYVKGEGNQTKDIYAEIDKQYKQNEKLTDENLNPFIIDKAGKIENGDGVFLLNYRGDRAIEFTSLFETFKYVDDAKKTLDKCVFLGMTQYDAELGLPKNFLINPPKINNTLTEWLSNHGARQYSVTETTKYGHLTYFFNGNKSGAFKEELETCKQIDSDVCDYATKPKMKAVEITDDLIKAMQENKADFYKTNLANPDMVGHTGDLEATIIACKTCDAELGKIIKTCKKLGISLITTADHGNAEEMVDDKGGRNTKHSANKVFLTILPAKEIKKRVSLNSNFLIKIAAELKEKGKNEEAAFGLTNIAATVCNLLEVEISPHFNESVIEVKK